MQKFAPSPQKKRQQLSDPSCIQSQGNTQVKAKTLYANLKTFQKAWEKAKEVSQTKEKLAYIPISSDHYENTIMCYTVKQTSHAKMNFNKTCNNT